MTQKCRTDTESDADRELSEVLEAISATTKRLAERVDVLSKEKKRKRRDTLWQRLKNYLSL